MESVRSGLKGKLWRYELDTNAVTQVTRKWGKQKVSFIKSKLNAKIQGRQKAK